MKRKTYKILKDISLIISGALWGIVPSLFIKEEMLLEFNWITLVLAIILLLIGIGFIEKLIEIIHVIKRKLNDSRGIIGLIAPYEINTNNSSWINGLSLNDITKIIPKIKVEKSISNLERYLISINPYGGVYPEDDASKLKTFQMIMDYVRDGGVYVNIADIPFYYAFDEKLGRPTDTTPLAEGIYNYPIRSFFSILITQKLKIYIVGVPKQTDNNENIIERVVLLPKNAISFYSKMFKTDQGQGTPIVAIPYGRGYFVFSTISLNKNNIKLLGDIIDKTIKLIKKSKKNTKQLL